MKKTVPATGAREEDMREVTGAGETTRKQTVLNLHISIKFLAIHRVSVVEQ